MLDLLLTARAAESSPRPVPLAAALAQAAATCGRLDQAAQNHPLRPALLFRARLDAVRRMAAADGHRIDPWHLAALLEGLRLRMDSELRIIDRGQIFAAARHALGLHRWLVDPDFDQEGAVQRAAAHLHAQADHGGTLLTAGVAVHRWLDAGGARAPLRTALVRHWQTRGVFSLPLPLTGAAALTPETPWDRDAWLPAFLTSLDAEAAATLDLLRGLERAWRTARTLIIGRRKNSHAAAAVDLLAAAPLLSATSLAAALGIAVKNATRLLDEFCRDGIALDVTHRAKRRLFALASLAPLREAVAGPRRPAPFRGRGRPPLLRNEASETEMEPPPRPPALPLARAGFDYGDLDAALAAMEATIRRTRSALERVGAGD
ncbi:hypothetical protein [Acidocella sp.]|jgi:hypothetical protein|uniref:hypothetical protein n=1 Tax=Acidocella sp. TaxID=50710 RepID=UPI002F42B357